MFDVYTIEVAMHMAARLFSLRIVLSCENSLLVAASLLAIAHKYCQDNTFEKVFVKVRL